VGKHWNKSSVDFFGHLKFAIRGISWGWVQKRKELEPYSEAEVIRCDEKGQEFNPLDDIDSDDLSVFARAPWLPLPAPRPDKSLIADEEIERKRKIFANKETSAVFDARLEGMTTAREIRQEHKLTKRQYEAARRRIRSQKSALIIEEDDHVLQLMVRWLKAMDFAVVTASTNGEGLRIYRECGPFAAVMMSYSLDLNCVELAMNIRKGSPSQNIIITTTYSSGEDVVRPSELAHVPILLKPFLRTELRAALDSLPNTVQEQPTNCCRQTRRRATAAKRPRQPVRGEGRFGQTMPCSADGKRLAENAALVEACPDVR
jgi:ActR/RegA family two-component response regulator